MKVTQINTLQHGAAARRVLAADCGLAEMVAGHLGGQIRAHQHGRLDAAQALGNFVGNQANARGRIRGESLQMV